MKIKLACHCSVKNGNILFLVRPKRLRSSVMAILHWPQLRRQNQPTSPSTSNGDSSATLQDAATSNRRNHTSIHMPNVFTKFTRRPSTRENPEFARRASILETAQAARQPEEIERPSITQELEVMFDRPDQGDNSDQTSERQAPKNTAEADVEYRYWRLQGGAGRRNAEIVPMLVLYSLIKCSVDCSLKGSFLQSKGLVIHTTTFQSQTKDHGRWTLY